MQSVVSAVTAAFKMTDDVWHRHANPWSVYTRFATIPPLIAAIWSRYWLGWWCLAPLAALALWLWLNPRVFPPVANPQHWASKGIYGEKIWAQQRDRVSAHHRTALRWLVIPGVFGAALLVFGLVTFAAWPTIMGTTLIVLVQLWRIDRLVWLYGQLSDEH